MVAAFLVLRLRRVLGRHKGDGSPGQDPFTPDKHSDQRVQTRENNVVQLPDQKDLTSKQDDAEKDDAEKDDKEKVEAEKIPETPLDGELDKISAASPDFERQEFLVGARAAFEVIIQAFAEGDTELLDSLLSDEVYNNFLQAIRAREADKTTCEHTSVRVVSTALIEA